MRIWKGNEMEGRRAGELTMFVECPSLTDRERRIISGLLEREDINRIYLGSGKVDVRDLEPGFLEALLRLKCRVIVETSIGNPLLYRFLEYPELSIVVRLDTKSKSEVAFKTDNGQNAIIYYPGTNTPLNAVKDGLYETIDTIIWDE